MVLEQNRAIARSIFEVGLNAGDVEAIVMLTADDFIDHDIHVDTGIRRGPEAMRQALSEIRNGFPDIQVTVEQTVAEGEWVVTRSTWCGTQQGTFYGIPPTNKGVEMAGVVLWRIVDGKIRERRGTTLPRPGGSMMALPTSRNRDADETELRAIEAAYDAAWNRGDAKALIDSFSTDAVVVNPRGQVANGSAEFAAIMAKFLTGEFQGSTHKSSVGRIRFVNADVAIVDGEARITGSKGSDAPVTHAYTDIFVRRNGRWLMSDIRAYVFIPLGV